MKTAFTQLIIEQDYMLVSEGGCCHVNLIKVSNNFIKDYNQLLITGVKGKIYKEMLKEAKTLYQDALSQYTRYLELYNEAHRLVSCIEQNMDRDKLDLLMLTYSGIKGQIDTLFFYNNVLGKFRKLVSNLVN